jgi:sec-independent protein translocase protein TatB
MNFLGVGPGEIFLILILLLVVVGPERLPGFARSAGRFVVRVRNWIASSPDAQLMLRARDELEQELEELRRSLTQEVETVRKELETVRGDLAEATRMVEESAGEVARTRVELEEVTETARTIAPPAASTAPADDLAAAAAPDQTAGELSAVGEPAAEPMVDPGPIGARQRAVAERESVANGQPVPRSFKPGQTPPPAQPAPAGQQVIDALDERIRTLSGELTRQLEALNAELQTLRAQAASASAPQIAAAAPSAAEPDPPPAAEPAAIVEIPPVADAAPLVAEPRRRCKGVTRSGEPCGAPPLRGQEYCRAHAGQQVLHEVTP